MRLTAFRISDDAPRLRPAETARDWMNDTGERFAYRCLPLTMANAHGWEILCPAPFEAYWNGGPRASDLVVKPLDGRAEFAVSHFGNGVLTFHTGYLFRTERAQNLYVAGPTNRPKDGIAPLTGVIETDWLPYPFTMNWLFTAPGGPITFEAGEPFCHFFPIDRDTVERVEPEIRPLASEPELWARHQQWTTSRAQFNHDLAIEGSEARAEKWQKSYARGQHPDGTPATDDHRTKVRACPFTDAAAPRFDANGMRLPPL